MTQAADHVDVVGRLVRVARPALVCAETGRSGPERRRRFSRYAPVGSRSPEAALAELSEQELVKLFRESQPAWTAPEGAYGAR